MKYQSFIMRVLCLLLIVGAVLGYNSMQKKDSDTEKDQQIASLTTRVEALEKQQDEILSALEEAAKAQEEAKKKAEEELSKAREELEEAYKNNKTIKVVVKEEIKGGLAAYYGSIRVFIPASQAARERIELKNLLGKELEVKLIELDLRNRKVVASRRVIEEEIYNAHKKELWKNA